MASATDTTDELMFHFRELLKAKLESGLAFDAAWDAAERQFGQIRHYEEECRSLRLKEQLFPGRLLAGALTVMGLLLGWMALELHSVGTSHGQLLAQTRTLAAPVVVGPTALAATPKKEDETEKLHDLTGQFTDAAGQPLAEALVLLILKTWPNNRYQQEDFHTKTDAAGRYKFEQLIPEGRQYAVMVTAYKPGSATTSKYILLRNPVGVPEPVNLQLAAAVKTPLVIKDSSGKPLAATVLPSGRVTKAGDDHLVYFQGSEILKLQANASGEVTLDCFEAGDTANVYVRMGAGEWVKKAFMVPADGAVTEITH